MNSWSGLDFFIFLIFALNTLLGMSRGATKEIISAMCVALALIFTIKFTIPLAHFFNSSPSISSVVGSNFVQNFMAQMNAGEMTADRLMGSFYSLSMLICFVGIFSVSEAVLAYTGAVEAFPFPYAAFNRKVGAALGCVRGYIFTLVLLVALAPGLMMGAGRSIHLGVFSGPLTGKFEPSAAAFGRLIASQLPESYRKAYEGNPVKAEDVMNVLSGPEGQQQQPGMQPGASQ